jgi:uncharacterized protein (DUF362 family)
MHRHVVHVWNVEAYDPLRIRDVVARSMRAMGVRPRGRVLLKPNVVIAHPELFPHAFTRPEVLEGVIRALDAVDGGSVTDLIVGERCGITIPTRFAFANAGYGEMLERTGARPSYFEEERQVRIELGEGALRAFLYAPEPLVRADFLVSCPKFKSHPWTGVTFALKNSIGYQDDAHRLIDHDFRLEDKIVDLQRIATPSLVVVDAIVGGKGRMLTPEAVPLGMIVVGTNPVAVDATCCRMLGIDPASIAHVRIASERGLGPIEEARIELGGDVGLEEARRRTRPYDEARIRVDAFFDGTPVDAQAGPPPDPGRSDYCWGGCPGAAEEAIDIIKQMQPTVYRDVAPMRLVYGDARGRDLPPCRGKTFFLGDCVRFDGRVGSERVTVESTYVDRARKDPRRARSESLPVKIVRSYVKALLSIGRPHLVVRGCPVSVAEHVLMLAIFGRVTNPYFDSRVTFSFTYHWLLGSLSGVLRSLFRR